MKAKIYLDFNSTHPPNTAALRAARDFYFANFANSSGLSLASQIVNKRIEEAREEIAMALYIEPQQIIFTSCATESNNLLIREFSARRRAKTLRIFSSPFEHPSVSETLKHLVDAEITYCSAEKNGFADSALFTKTDWSDFDFAAMMAVQNESGIILPLSELAEAIPENVPILADFSQALPKLAYNATTDLQPEIIRELTAHNVFITATGHKLGAGFGAGLIITPILKNWWKNTILLAGGNQEHGFRAGSHNTEAIIALAEALKHKLSENNYDQWQKVTQTFEQLLLEKLAPIRDVMIIGKDSMRAPGTTLLLLPQIPIDFLIMALDRVGITVSTGTSCKSRSRSPSAALIAMGYSENEALSVVRLSYDQNLTSDDMAFTADSIATAVSKLAP